MPGRLCLFGEHSDWAGGYRRSNSDLRPGYCLVTGTDQGVTGELGRLDHVLELESVLADGTRVGPERIDADLESLAAAAASGGFFSYVTGVALEIAERFGARGLRLHLRSNLPIRKGLSSSAAVSVLAARAYSLAYGLDLDAGDEMEVAYAGERRAGSECGRMDQVCALGRRPAFLTFDGDRMDVEPLEPGGVFHLLVVDLRREKDTRRILADLNRCFPTARGRVAASVREALGQRNEECLRRARVALERGDARALGALMIEAQEVFDRRVAPACLELQAPRLHEVLAHPAVRELAWGGKGVGSQGDGCAQFVARGPGERTALAERLERDVEVDCFPVTIGGT